jgi:hypothetical protein
MEIHCSFLDYLLWFLFPVRNFSALFILRFMLEARDALYDDTSHDLSIDICLLHTFISTTLQRDQFPQINAIDIFLI